MTDVMTIPGFAGEIVRPGDETYESHREIWNAVVDRRPALIARCGSSNDVAAAVRYGRDAGLEIAVKCGGHGVLGLCVPEGGLMIDLTPMGEVRVDPARRRATVGGGALLRTLDRATEPHGLATTAGNVSHTGVGGLTLGGGMGSTSSPTRVARAFAAPTDRRPRSGSSPSSGSTTRTTSSTSTRTSGPTPADTAPLMEA